MQKHNGITLIALVITIVVLLIIAGITITTVLGEDGTIAQLQLSAGKVKNEQTQAESDLEILEENVQNRLNSETISEKLIANGRFDGTVNTPKLGQGMKAITWNGSSWVEPKTNAEWYNYSEHKWANAQTTDDGSYWVWIPRYAYRITGGYHSNTAGTIDIKFLKGTENTDGKGTDIVANLTTIAQEAGEGPSTVANQYVVHPAFTSGPDGNIAGIWVAKFEASHSDTMPETPTTQGTSTTLKIQPNVSSWRNETVSNMFNTCKNYNSALNSHLMKNSEWGAVAYLAHSSYGLNGSEIGINTCSSYITGAGPKNGTTTYEYDGTFASTCSYTTTNGQQASTTENVYGVYDMSGGAYEYVAAYLSGATNSSTGSLSSASSWMVDKYSGTSDDRQTNYQANNNKYGDAVWETSSSSSSPYANAWNADYTYYPYSSQPVFIRGGSYDNNTIAGLFYFNGLTGGMIEYAGFRPVLITP